MMINRRLTQKDKAYLEVLARLDGPPHAEDCVCQPW